MKAPKVVPGEMYDLYVPYVPHLDHQVSVEEIKWRMKGYLDCLRALKEFGPPDPKFVEYLVEKTGEKAP